MFLLLDEHRYPPFTLSRLPERMAHVGIAESVGKATLEIDLVLVV